MQIPVTATDLNKAILLYLDYPWKLVPKPSIARLYQPFGADGAKILEEIIIKIMDEMDAVPVDWTKNSLGEGGALIAAWLQKMYPDLSFDAVRALTGNYTWNWR